jgi:hypothetical protein
MADLMALKLYRRHRKECEGGQETGTAEGSFAKAKPSGYAPHSLDRFRSVAPSMADGEAQGLVVTAATILGDEIMKRTTLLLIVLVLVATGIISPNSQAQIFKRLPQLPQTFTYVYDGKSYHFTTRKTTYDEVVQQLGSPTKSGTSPDGATIIMYRTVDDRSNGAGYAKYFQTTITDGVFVFDKKLLLVSIKLDDKSSDPVAIKEVAEAKQRSQPTAPAAGKVDEAPKLTMAIQTKFEMALIEEDGNYRCSWPLSESKKKEADLIVNNYKQYINILDYKAEVAKGMSLRNHESNAEYCLDKREREKFDGAVEYLGK